MRYICLVFLLLLSSNIQAFHQPFFNMFHWNYSLYNSAYAGFDKKTSFSAMSSYMPLTKNEYYTRWGDPHINNLEFKKGLATALNAGTYVSLGKSGGIGLSATAVNYFGYFQNSNTYKISSAYLFPIGKSYLSAGIGVDYNRDAIFMKVLNKGYYNYQSSYTNWETGFAFINPEKHYHAGVSYLHAGRLPVKDSLRKLNSGLAFILGTDLLLKNGVILKTNAIVVGAQDFGYYAIVGNIQAEFKSKIFTGVSYSVNDDIWGINIGKQWKKIRGMYSLNTNILMYPFKRNCHQLSFNYQL